MKPINLISLLSLGTIATAIPIEAIDAVEAIESTTESDSMTVNSCYRKDKVLWFNYDIHAEGFKDTQNVCRDLHNALLKQQCAPTNKGCTIDGNGNLHWWFNDSRYCSSDMVEHAWWEVTHNDHGMIHC